MTNGGPPLVSCIVPVWNAGPFLEEAVRSVLGQTYDHWELLLVDDGSTDGSLLTIERFACEHPATIRCLRHPEGAHRGVTATRNLGLRHAQGRYIAFLDADDVWLPTKLQDQVGLLEANGSAAMVYGRTRFWYGWTGLPEDEAKDSETDLGLVPDTLVEPPGLVPLWLRNEDAVCTVDSVMLRREVVDAVGGFDEAFPDFYEDFVLWMKIALRWPVYVAAETWDRYRQHQGNSAVPMLAAGLWDPVRPNPARGTYLYWLAFHLSKERITDAAVWRELHRQLRPYRHPVLGAGERAVRTKGRAAARQLVLRAAGVRGLEALKRLRRSDRARRPLGPGPHHLDAAP